MKVKFVLSLVLICITGNLLHATDIYVKKDYKNDQCVLEYKCPTLTAAFSCCKLYDTIILEEKPALREGSLDICGSLTLTTSSGRIELEIGYGIIAESDPFCYCINIYRGCECILKNFVFSISQGDNTPENGIINLGYEDGRVGHGSNAINSCYLRLDNCEFKRMPTTAEIKDVNLTSYLIGPNYGGDVYLYNCRFTNLISKDTLFNVNNFYSYNSTFTNLVSKDGKVVFCQGGYIDVIDSTFENCISESNNGGALHVTELNHIIIGGYNSITKFIGCKANSTYTGSGSKDFFDKGCGGAIYLKFFDYSDKKEEEEDVDDLVLNISNVEFDKTNKNLAQRKGNCMFVIGKLIKNYWTKENVPFMKDYSANDEDFLFHYSDDEDYKIYDLKRLYNGDYEDGPDKLYVSDGGSDSYDCESSEHACHTVDHATSTVRYHNIDLTFSANYTLNNSESVNVNKEDGKATVRRGDDDVWIIVKGGSLSCSGDVTIDGLKFVIESSSVAALTVSGRRANLKSLTFISRNNITCEYSCYGNYLTSCATFLSLDNCEFRNCNGSVSAVNIYGGSVKISDCEFEYCGIINGGEDSSSCGGALTVYMYYSDCFEAQDIKSLCSIKGCEFIGCYALNGGAVCLEVSDDVKSITFKDNVFNNNSLTSSDGHGYDILIKTNNLTKVVTRNNFPFLKGLSENNESAYAEVKYEDYENAKGIYVNLANYINEYNVRDNVFVGTVEEDDNTCTNENDTCSSLSEALTKYINYNNYITFTVVKDFILSNEQFGIAYESYFKGFDKDSNFIFVNSELYLYNKTTFYNLTISFVPSGNENPPDDYHCDLGNSDCNPVCDSFYQSGCNPECNPFMNASCEALCNDNAGDTCIGYCDYYENPTCNPYYGQDYPPDYNQYYSNHRDRRIEHYINSVVGSVEFSLVTFKRLGDSSLGVSLISVCGDLRIDNCTFDSLKFGSGSIFDSSNNYNTILINVCAFNNCENEVNGGGLYLSDYASIYKSYSVTVSSCTFKGCKAIKGGAIYVSLDYYNNFLISGNTYTENSVNKDGNGSNIYVKTSFYDSIDFNKIFPGLPAQSDDGVYVLLCGEGMGNEINLISVLNGSLKVEKHMYFIGKEGKGSTCENKDNMCVSFSQIDAKYTTINVTIVGNSEDCSVVSSSRYNIVGENGDSCIVLNNSGSSFKFNVDSSFSNLKVLINESLSYHAFSNTKGILTFSSVTFQPNTTLESIRVYVLNVGDNSKMIVNNCVFSDFVIESKGGAIHAEGLITVDHCTFRNIVGDSDGLAIKADFYKYNSHDDEKGLDSDDSNDYVILEIIGSEFINCKTTNKKGGALYISVDNNYTCCIKGADDKNTIFQGCGSSCTLYHYHIIWEELGCLGYCEFSQGGAIYFYQRGSNGNLTMDKITFEGDSQDNTGVCGYDMFIGGDELYNLLTEDNITFLSENSKYKGIYYMGKLGECYDASYQGTSLKDLRESRISRSGSDDGFPWWAILIIVLVVIIIIVVIVIVVVIVVCKRKGGSSSSSSGGGEKEMNETKKDEGNKESEGETA